MVIRPLVPDDADLYRELLVSLSERDRYLRFFHTVRRVGEAEIEPFVRDNPNMIGLMAIENGEAVGAAHAFIDEARSSAEFAVQVRPEYRHRGIGGQLLEHAIRELHKRGVRELVAHSFIDNSEFTLVATDAHMRPEREGAGVNLWRLPI